MTKKRTPRSWFIWARFAQFLCILAAIIIIINSILWCEIIDLKTQINAHTTTATALEQ